MGTYGDIWGHMGTCGDMFVICRDTLEPKQTGNEELNGNWVHPAVYSGLGFRAYMEGPGGHSRIG